MIYFKAGKQDTMVEGAKTHYAICMLLPDGNSGVSGCTKFTQVEGQQVTMAAEMNGLTPGKHGFHVHQFGKYTHALLSRNFLFFVFE